MAWDDEAKRVAFKAIGTVESNLRYDVIYYGDSGPTVGITQFYATRAAQLLNDIRATAAWVGVEDSLTDDLIANDENDWSYWSTRSLTRAEGNSLKPVMLHPDARGIQHVQFLADMEEYRRVAVRMNLDVENNTKAFIYFAMLYHQSPKFAKEVLAQAGYNPSMSRVNALAKNHQWYRKFPTRLSVAYGIIDAWDDDLGDIDLNPSEDGPDEDTPNIRDDGYISRVQSLVRQVRLINNTIHIVGNQGETVQCQPTPNSRLWLPGQVGYVGPPIDDDNEDITGPYDPEVPPPPDDGTAASLAAKLESFLLARINRYSYSQGPGRMTPDTSGVVDCSSLILFAYMKCVPGTTYGNMGTFTGAMGGWTGNYTPKGRYIVSNTPNGWFDSKGGQTPFTYPDPSLLKIGDLVLVGNATSWTRHTHVEMVISDNRLIGYGGATPKGPYIKPNASSYIASWRRYTVRRHLNW